MVMLKYLLTLILLLSCVTSYAQQKPWESYIPEAHKIGEARFKYLWIDVYDVALYSNQQPFQFDNSFALKIDYLRHFKGEKIAERSIQEIRKQGFDNDELLQKWQQQMEAIFPDVQKGDSITGIAGPESKTLFYMNNELIGEIDDARFRDQFFNIWLSNNSSAPGLTKRLLGN